MQTPLRRIKPPSRVQGRAATVSRELAVEALVDEGTKVVASAIGGAEEGPGVLLIRREPKSDAEKGACVL